MNLFAVTTPTHRHCPPSHCRGKPHALQELLLELRVREDALNNK